MTYCIAWKTDSSAYIFADSAITKDSDGEKNRLETTSFLEKQGQMEQKKYVVEGAYKILNGENYAIGMAGDAHFATEVVTLLDLHLSVGRSVNEAIKMSIDNFLDFDQRPRIELVIISYSDQPVVFTLKNRDQFKTEHEKLVLLGSPTKNLTSYTTNFFNSFMESWKKEINLPDRDEILFARMLGLLQSYGMHRYTLEQGIGGTYSGVRVHKDGLSEQPDTCFLISGENLAFDSKKIASVSSRDNCLCIINSDMPEIIIPNRVSNIKDDTVVSAAKKSRDIFDSGKFKYIILLHLIKHTVCIVNMNYRHNHMFLNLDIRDSKKGALGFLISNKLEFDLNHGYDTSDNIVVYYYPFISAQAEQLSEINKNIEQIRLGKLFNQTIEKYKFFIYQSGNVIDWFYGNEESILPFLKHYKDHEYLQIVDLFTDLTVCELKNGELAYPELDYSISEYLSKLPSKSRQEDIFIFDTYVPNRSEPYQMNVLALSFEEAKLQANITLQSEYGKECGLIFSGKRFYHPEFY